MSYCVGLTGSIGSGKSTVASFFATLGVQIINADLIAKKLSASNSPVYNTIVSHFGIEILNEQKELNRKKLRDIIFSDPKEKLWLENLMHPEIRRQIAKEVSLSDAPYLVVEIPLLTDLTQYPFLNRVLLITSPLELKLKRVIDRDLCTREQALAILASQPTDQERLAIATDILVNDDNLSLLQQKVSTLHEAYLDKVDG
jgi:dephospho-CoA kinase